MPIISHNPPLFFSPSNIHLKRALSYPLEICTLTCIELFTAFTALYPLVTSWAKLLMLSVALPEIAALASHSMPLFVSLPTCTHSGITPAATTALKTSLVWSCTACTSWGNVYPVHAAGLFCLPGSAQESL